MKTLAKDSPPLHPPAWETLLHDTARAPAGMPARYISGSLQNIIRILIGINMLLVATWHSGNPLVAYRQTRKLLEQRNRNRGGGQLYSYALSGRRFFVNYVIPGWPSGAFNRFIRHHLNTNVNREAPSLSTLVFAITKKCGFRCEHCCEWNNLNKPETLDRDALLQIIRSFHRLGVSQVQLSGGEPLNRFSDILYLLDQRPAGVDFWVYTTGYALTYEKAIALKQHGLTGITLSLDHVKEENHDAFRGVQGAYRRALLAAAYCRKAGLAVCFSLCATRDFVTRPNLEAYLELAKNSGASFIQFLEPRAVGHYDGKDVGLHPQQQELLEEIFLRYNYTPGLRSYPIISYHGYISRHIGCSGGGLNYVYVDTDGDVHNCPFCQSKLFSATGPGLAGNIQRMKISGCGVNRKTAVKA